MTTYRALCVAILLALISVPAGAAPFNSLSMDVGVCDPNAPQNCIKPDSSGNVPITGTISASLGGFTPSAAGARGTPLTVTISDSSGTLPTGAVVIVSNVGTTNPMYCNVNAVAATTSDQLISPNSWFAFTIPVAVTTLRCIATGGSTTANTLGGAGLATGAGGGTSGGSGSNASVGVTGAAVPASGTYGGMNVGGNLTGFAGLSAGADAVTNSTAQLMQGAFSYFYNGTTWDRVRGTTSGGMLVNVSNTLTALTPGDAIATGTYVSGSPTLGAVLLWNGTTYDRWKSSGTGFAAVNPGTPANWGVGATAAAVPANAMYSGALDAVGGTNLVGIAADPCQTSVKTTLPITLATAAVKVIATGVAAKKMYVCQIQLNNNAADSIAIFEATTATVCATAAVAVVGAGTSVATAATGYNFAATGGISLGNGANQVLVTTVNNNDLCIAQSAATQLTGSITYVTR